MKQQTVSAGLFRSYLDFAAAKGASASQLLERCAVWEADLADQDNRVPFSAYRCLVETAIAATGDGALSMRFATETRLEEITVVGLVCQAALSMADAMVQLNRYAKLVVEVDIMDGAERFTVMPEPDGLWIVDNRPNPNDFPQLTEEAFARFIGEMRRFFPDVPFAIQIQVTHPAPPYVAAYDSILQVPVTFGCHRNAIQVTPEWLALEFDESPYVFGIFADKADALLAELERDTTMRGRLEAHLLPQLQRGEFTMEDVAAQMGMSRQTLYRRLKEEGVTFAEVWDALRFRMAADYLRARKVSVNETAYLVGFSEASSFVRAFKRWSGMGPGEFRDQA